MDSVFQFPAVAPNDPSDVALAVETAAALWRQGDSREALKWLRRAAETAESEGDDLRALSLARAAADLKDRLPHLSSVPAPPSVPPPAPFPVRVSAPPSVAPVTPPSTTPAARSVPPAPALVASLTTDLGLGPNKLEAWSPPSSRVAPQVDAPPEPEPEPEPEPPAEKVSEPMTPVAPSAAPRADSRTALRVSVESLSNASGSLLVRILAEGERAVSGAREAFLVPLEPGVDLTNS